MDELGLFRGQVASGRGLGGAARGRGALPTPECRQERPGGGAVACQGGLVRCCEAGSVWRGAAVWAKAGGPACRLGRVAAIRALWARPVHALNVLDEMPWHSRALGWSWDLAGWGYSLRQNHWTSWYDPRFKVTMQRQNHVKTGHAHQVFDKMPRALRHFLEWQKTPDQCLCG